MFQKLRMGYVGCGFLAQKVHIPNIVSLDECELVALAEVRRDLGERVRRRYGVPRLHATHHELAQDADVEAVMISASYFAQGEIAADLLRAGKDVLVEKPMAVSVEQGERVLAAERDSGRRLMVAYMKRYDAGNVVFKDLLDGVRQSGQLGSVLLVRNHGFGGDWIAGLDTPLEKTDEPYPASPEVWPSWLAQPFRKGYIGYLQQYTHNLNLLRWLLGAGGDVKVKAVDLDRGDGQTGVVILDIGGVRATIESGWMTYHGWEEHTQVYFQHGWLKTCAPPLLLPNVPATVEIYRGRDDRKTAEEVFPAGGRTWAYKEEVRHFARCLRTGEPFRSPAADTMHDLRIIEDIYRHHVRECG